MTRKLVTVAKIVDTFPIEGADVIVRAQVKGWNLVTQKSNGFKAGDLVAYFEIDSLLPEIPEFEFMSKYKATNFDGTTGYRLKTIKLKGQVSQGLILPLIELHKFFPAGWFPEEGADITDFLGVKKYEAPIPAELGGMAKGMFPGFLVKTDEERVQNLQEMLDEIAGTPAYVSLKIDGASMSVYSRDGDFGVCTRSVDLLKNESNSLWKAAIALKLEEKLKAYKELTGTNIALQGEIYGENIQKNRLKIKGQAFAVFNVFDIDKYKFFDFEDMIAFCAAYDIPTVPILDSNYVIHNDIEKYVEEAKVQYPNGAHAEGKVFRPLVEIVWRGSRVSFKSINPTFLLKNDE